MADELIKRSAVLNDLESLWDYSTVDGITASTVLKQFKTDVQNVPSVDAVPVVRCKNCKYFELNSWANVGGHPLIVAHEICKRWGDGCKTSPEGYCFMGERKDGKDGDANGRS